MFLIYLDETIIHDPRFADARRCFNPILRKKVNSPGSLEFDVSPYNAHVDDITTGKRIRVAKDNTNTCIWEGSVQKRKKNFDGTVHITCIGRLAEFANVPIGRALFNSEVVSGEGSYPGAIRKLFTYANKILPLNQRIALGECAFEWQKGADGYDITNEVTMWERDDCPTLWEALTKNQESRIQGDVAGLYADPTAPLAAPYYGIIMPRYSFSNTLIVDIIREADQLEGENIIRFGRNLLDLSQLWDDSEAYNGIMPVCEVRDSVDGEYHLHYWNFSTHSDSIWCEENDVNNCILWDETAVQNMGGQKICKVVNFGRDVDVSTLEDLAVETLVNASASKYEINVSAIDMALVSNEYDLFDVGKYYEIYDNHQGLLVAYMLNEMEMHLMEPEQNRYTFGARTTETLTGAIASGTLGGSKNTDTTPSGWTEPELLGICRNLQMTYRYNATARLIEITVDGTITAGSLSGATPEYFSYNMPSTFCPDGNMLFSLGASNGNNHFLRVGILPGNSSKWFIYSASSFSVASEYITTKFVYGLKEGAA